MFDAPTFQQGQTVRFTRWDKRMGQYLEPYVGKTGSVALIGGDGKYMVSFGPSISQHFWIGASRLEVVTE